MRFEHDRQRGRIRDSGLMTSSTATDRNAPLTDDALLEERVTLLLERANVPQLWMMFLGDDDVQSELLLPFADLPRHPDELVDTPDLGRAANATVLGHRVAQIMREFGFAQVVFAWERPGSATARRGERRWARALAAACAVQGARVRAQFVVHDRGVRPLTPDDYLTA